MTDDSRVIEWMKHHYGERYYKLGPEVLRLIQALPGEQIPEDWRNPKDMCAAVFDLADQLLRVEGK